MEHCLCTAHRAGATQGRHMHTGFILTLQEWMGTVLCASKLHVSLVCLPRACCCKHGRLMLTVSRCNTPAIGAVMRVQAERVHSMHDARPV
eukprot:scaffold124775_cov23-Tisochrysis_lutea.AAC.1